MIKWFITIVLELDQPFFREDETYCYGFMPYNEDIEAFMKQATAEVERVKAEHGLKFPYGGEDILHYSTLPWANFTSLNHARRT